MWLDGDRIKPCRTFCHEVERLCPYFLPAEKSGPGSQYAGEPSFLCIGNLHDARIVGLYHHNGKDIYTETTYSIFSTILYFVFIKIDDYNLYAIEYELV
jgi:hypothetical protein